MVELLAPAGDKECFKAALMAGTDAIYVGGKKYGARAYAGNFEQEDLIECLQLAHLFGRKVYLTVNTLMKQQELDTLGEFLKPLAIYGLDGVIVQDFGALKYIRERFPMIELHASTQMTVTGAYGASLLKNYGISRIVPARELSLKEITVIKEKTGLEIETFVHGAMCYGYSGQCLFSSMLGERSGNRGRCAGPCRLPYTVSYEGKRLNRNDEMYQLSLKDLCTLEVLPQLIEAGIDSFKIEGRMKTPEYVSFVTAMYRKYIDLYKADAKRYRVSAEDMNMLKQKFSRGSIQSGYYFQHNGRELVTLNKPGYQSFSEDATDKGSATDVNKGRDRELKIDLTGHFVAKENQQVSLTVSRKDNPEVSVIVFGDIAGPAQKCAATLDDVKKQLCKTGNTNFKFDEITFDLEDGLYLPNKMLNDLRRSAITQIEEQILQMFMISENEFSFVAETRRKEKEISARRQFFVEVRTAEQFSVLGAVEGIDRICLDVDMFTEENRKLLCESAKRIRNFGTRIYIKFPHVCRQKTIKNIDRQRALIEEILPDGFCVGNLESLGYIKEHYPDIDCKNLMTDAGFYIFNENAAEFSEEYGMYEHILSYELHRNEIKQLAEKSMPYGHRFYLPVYGYIPLMEAAGCLLKTNGVCRNGKGTEQLILTDRYKKDRIVLTHCDRCENTIYNSVPLSLHKEKKMISELPLAGIVLKFTIENVSQMKMILDFWNEKKSQEAFVMHEFTKGHFLKSVE